MWRALLLHLGLLATPQGIETDQMAVETSSTKRIAGEGISAGRRVRRRLATARSWAAIDLARAELLGENGYADPAWRLLLGLYIAESEGRSCSVENACSLMALPASSATRWIRAMAADGSVVAEHGLKPGALIELAASKSAAMDDLIDYVSALSDGTGERARPAYRGPSADYIRPRGSSADEGCPARLPDP